MAQPAKPRRILLKVGAALTLTFAVLFVLSLFMFVRWDSPPTRGRVSYGFELTSGVLSLGRTESARPADTIWGSMRVAGPHGFMPLPFPIIYGESGVLALFIPLWLPLVLAGLPTVVIALKGTRARKKIGCCPSCGYDLAGNTTGVCPECGKA